MALFKTLTILGVVIALIATITCENTRGNSGGRLRGSGGYESSGGTKNGGGLSSLAGGDSRGTGSRSESGGFGQGSRAQNNGGLSGLSGGLKGSGRRGTSGEERDSSIRGQSSSGNQRSYGSRSDSGSSGGRHRGYRSESGSKNGNLGLTGSVDDFVISSSAKQTGSEGESGSSISDNLGQIGGNGDSSSGSAGRGSTEKIGTDRPESQSSLSRPGQIASQGSPRTSSGTIGVNHGTNSNKNRR